MIANLPTPAPGMIEGLLISGAALLTIAVMIKTLWPAARKPPLEAEFVSKEECRRVHECAAHETSKLAVKIERLGDKIDQVRVDVSLDRQRASSELHEKINGIAQAVARLEERTS